MEGSVEKAESSSDRKDNVRRENDSTVRQRSLTELLHPSRELNEKSREGSLSKKGKNK